MPQPQLLASLGPFGGVDLSTDATRVPPPKGVSAINVVPFRTYGAYVSSQGRVHFSNFNILPGAISFFSNPLGNATQIGGPTVAPIILAGIFNSGAGANQLYLGDVIAGFTQVPFAAGITITQFFTNNAIPDIHPGSLSSNVYISCQPPLRINTDGNLHPWQYNAPNSAPGGIVGGAGPLVGTYFYVYTYVSGGGAGVQESSPSPISGPFVASAANGQVFLTGITASGQSDIVARNIYRIGGTLGTFFLVGTINDNVTTIFTDSTADLAVTGQALVLHRDPPPANGWGYVESHKGRLWGINSNAANLYHFGQPTATSDLWYSNFQEFFSFDNVNAIIPIGQESESKAGDYGVALASVGSVLTVLKSKSLWVIYGDSPADPFLPRKIADYGCIAPGSVAKGEGVVAWLGPQGVFLFDGQTPTYISKDIKKYLNTKTATQMFAASGWWFQKSYFLSFPDDNKTWVYSLETQDWWQLPWATPFAIYETNAWFQELSVDPIEYVYVADSSVVGQIDQAFGGSGFDFDKNLPIASTYVGRIEDSSAILQTPIAAAALKRYRFLEVVLTPLTNQTASVTVQVDPLQGGASQTFSIPTGQERVVFSLPPSLTGRSVQLTLNSATGSSVGPPVVISGVNLYGWLETAFGKVT